MTDRELMQQALEALQQSKTLAPFGAEGVVYWEGVKIHEAAITALRERLAQPEQEPVAWFSPSGNLYKTRFHATANGEQVVTPLYTTPPQRKPIPAHEIVTLYDERPMCDGDMITFARSIEAAHGIKGEA